MGLSEIALTGASGMNGADGQRKVTGVLRIWWCSTTPLTVSHCGCMSRHAHSEWSVRAVMDS